MKYFKGGSETYIIREVVVLYVCYQSVLKVYWIVNCKKIFSYYFSFTNNKRKLKIHYNIIPNTLYYDSNLSMILQFFSAVISSFIFSNNLNFL